VIAAAILLGGMPVVASAFRQDTQPAFSLDICHPIQAINTASAGCSLPTLVRCFVSYLVGESALDPVAATIMIARAAEAPDPPPPKARVP
jgi:hypothetical protein